MGEVVLAWKAYYKQQPQRHDRVGVNALKQRTADQEGAFFLNQIKSNCQESDCVFFLSYKRSKVINEHPSPFYKSI